jgi:hypothetical protein
MPRQRWKLTQATAGQPEVDEFGEQLGQDPRPFSLLAEIAKDPESGLREIAPGVYRIDRDGPV